jgi:hypothetical protein
MVQFRFWSGHFRTIDGSVDGCGLLGLCNWQESVLYNPLFGVKGTERSSNAEDLKGNPTEYTHHTIGKLANCAGFKSQGKGPNQETPTFNISQITSFNFNFHFCDINVLVILFLF